MSAAPTCVRCGRPMADGAYACSTCALSLAESLRTAAGHAEDVEATIARQARFGAGSRGSTEDPMPVDLTAAAKLRPIETAICGWARIVTEETGRRPRWRVMAGPLCPPRGTACDHDSCHAIRRRLPPPPIAQAAAWLSRQTGWLRKHPAAGEAFAELHQACEALARLVDRPPDKDLVGMCDCGRVLYAAQGRGTVRCPGPTCRLNWDVEKSREVLRGALDGRLVTAAEAAWLAAYLDSDRNQQQIQRLIAGWVRRGKLLARGEIRDEPDEDALAADPDAGPRISPTYRFGDVVNRLATAVHRERKGVAA